MKYSNILNILDDNIYYLQHHNKNTTKKQDAAVQEIADAWHALKIMINETIKKCKEVKKMYKSMGYKKYSDIEIIEKGGKLYALDGWNGEKYYNAWECDKLGEPLNGEQLTATPAYKFIDDDVIIIDYEIE